MPFIQQILKSDSLSIVGLEKNTGKTVCLNYVLERLKGYKVKMAVTSIGIDGESRDQVTNTQKPEIFLNENTIFATSEKHYKERRLISELISIGSEMTSLGRIVTASTKYEGKVLLSGPSSTASLTRWMNETRKTTEADLIIVDGALSRLSLASPAVCSSMILSTGAALSSNIKTLVNKTAYVVELIKVDITKHFKVLTSDKFTNGIFVLGNNEWIKLKTESSLVFNGEDASLIEDSEAVYITGALTDRFLNLVSQKKGTLLPEVIVKDFTKIFVSEPILRNFSKRGGKIKVLSKSSLIAVCVNPLSPAGFKLDSDTLCKELSDKIELPVYDIVKNGYEA